MLKDEFVRLHNDYPMPKLGFGTYGISKDEAYEVLSNALKVGYRHIETAPIYLNDTAIAKAIKASNVPRESIFITSKIPPHIKDPKSVERVVQRIMKNLSIDYIDALLINNPTPWGKEDEDFSKENLEVYRVLEKLYKAEVIGAIGLSNFTVAQMEALLKRVEISPHIHQLGVFIGHRLKDIVEFSQSKGMVIQGHSPLARGRIFTLDIFNHLETPYETPAQIALRYVLQQGVYPVVKTTSIKRMEQNINIDKPLSQKTLDALNHIEQDVRDYRPPGAKYVL